MSWQIEVDSKSVTIFHERMNYDKFTKLMQEYKGSKNVSCSITVNGSCNDIMKMFCDTIGKFIAVTVDFNCCTQAEFLTYFTADVLRVYPSHNLHYILNILGVCVRRNAMVSLMWDKKSDISAELTGFRRGQSATEYEHYKEYVLCA